MDYIGDKCPVCGKYFHADDDIVVCPECGTPHHRECYEELGHCANLSLHAEGYDYSEQRKDSSDNAKVCPNCGKTNEQDSFFCKHCGTPLDRNAQTDNQNEQNANGFPFGAGQPGNPVFVNVVDPLGGVPGDTDLGDGVTAGEAAKYVKQNTPYFIRVFSNIKNFNKSKFNFSAALFTGGYLLYRKMYKIGAVLVALQLAMMIFEMYLTVTYSSLFTEFSKIYTNAGDMSQMLSNYTAFMESSSPTDILVVYLPTLIDLARIVMMIVVGLCTNRMYMTHCKKKIIAIKNNTAEGENPDTVLQTKGGVNVALAVSLLVTAMLITYLPRIIGLYM